MKMKFGFFFLPLLFTPGIAQPSAVDTKPRPAIVIKSRRVSLFGFVESHEPSQEHISFDSLFCTGNPFQPLTTNNELPIKTNYTHSSSLRIGTKPRLIVFSVTVASPRTSSVKAKSPLSQSFFRFLTVSLTEPPIIN